MTKKTIYLTCLIGLLLAGGKAEAQGQAPEANTYSTFYYQRASLFETLPVTPEDIIFLGNSITNGCEWAELFDNPHVKNRGISGDITRGVYDRLAPILKGRPAKIFLLIGINDVARGIAPDSIVANIRQIARKIRTESPGTRLYIQSLLPVTDHYHMFEGHTSRGQLVPEINAALPDIAQATGAVYIDLYTSFIDPATGKMNTAYTNDGVHMLGKGYLKWRDLVRPYIDAQ